MVGVNWADWLNNMEMLTRIREKDGNVRNDHKKKNERAWTLHWKRHDKECHGGIINKSKERVRKRSQLTDNIKMKERYEATKRCTENWRIWKTDLNLENVNNYSLNDLPT